MALRPTDLNGAKRTDAETRAAYAAHAFERCIDGELYASAEMHRGPPYVVRLPVLRFRFDTQAAVLLVTDKYERAGWVVGWEREPLVVVLTPAMGRE